MFLDAQKKVATVLIAYNIPMYEGSIDAIQIYM